MELTLQTIKNDCVALVAHAQTVTESEVSCEDRGGASKLLTVSATAQTIGVEAVEGKARVTGKVTYKILYLDREGKIGGLDYFGEFDTDIVDSRISSAKAHADVSVLDLDCRIVADNMRLSTVCDIRIYQIVSNTTEAVASAPCESLQQEVTATTLTAMADAAFEVVEEVESGENVDRVLLFDAKVVPTGTSAQVDSTLVEGKILADVVYLCQGEVRQTSLNFPFAEQLDMEGDSDLDVYLKSCRLVLTGEDDNTVLRLEGVIGVRGYKAQTDTYTVVQDVFCPNVDTEVETNAFVCRNKIGDYSDTSELVAPLGIADYNRTLSAVVSRVNIADFVPDQDGIVAEGLVVVGVVYLDADNRMQAGQIEMPFSQRFEARGVDADTMLEGQAVGANAKVDAKGDVLVQLLLSVKVYRAQTVRYMVGVQEKPMPQPLAVASVYFAAPEDGLWDIAHAVKVAPSALLAMNPDLATPAKETRRVLVFRHRDIEE